MKESVQLLSETPFSRYPWPTLPVPSRRSDLQGTAALKHAGAAIVLSPSACLLLRPPARPHLKGLMLFTAVLAAAPHAIVQRISATPQQCHDALFAALLAASPLDSATALSILASPLSEAGRSPLPASPSHHKQREPEPGASPARVVLISRITAGRPAASSFAHPAPGEFDRHSPSWAIKGSHLLLHTSPSSTTTSTPFRLTKPTLPL
ncbi:hypothetical protein BU16DRAFT_607667, partial [Lophium mytilinum]